MDLEGVESLARKSHAGQKDKLDRDYFDHHLTPVVGKLSGQGMHAVMAGWLHDILEDTPVTSADLVEAGVPAEVVCAVESVTKREGERYEDLITRAAADPLGKLVKLADNQVNHESNPALALRDKRKAAELLQKYERAHRQLEHHPSHLFVVHGTIGEVVHDAVIIPTDAYLTVEEHWRKFGDSEPLPTRADFSAGWARWGTSSAWLVDVASRDYQTVLAHLGEALHAIAEARPWHGSDERVPRGRRPLPLVVLPVLGIGSGGHGDEKGSVLSRLTQLLKDAVGKLPFDIALVTPDPAVYAAAQYTRQLNQTKHPVDEEAIKLADKAQSGELALFLGAGVSIPAGLPTWHELIDKLAGQLAKDEDRTVLEGLEVTDKAQLIEQFEPEGFKKRVAEITAEATTPSLVHALLAGLDVDQVVTTNYDTLFEEASKAAGHQLDVVLPHQTAVGQRRWILKMHGDVEHSDNIVLTRRHMVMYDAANRPSAALLQSLLLTKHLVFIGASMTDPNILRLMHEVDEYRTSHGQSPRTAYGTVLDVAASGRAQARLWENQLTWVDLPGKDIGSGARTLEILLDRVGMFASSNSSWLLDQRFEGLLDERHRRFAVKVRELAEDDILMSSTWAPLREALTTMGIASH